MFVITVSGFSARTRLSPHFALSFVRIRMHLMLPTHSSHTWTDRGVYTEPICRAKKKFSTITIYRIKSWANCKRFNVMYRSISIWKHLFLRFTPSCLITEPFIMPWTHIDSDNNASFLILSRRNCLSYNCTVVFARPGKGDTLCEYANDEVSLHFRRQFVMSQDKIRCMKKQVVRQTRFTASTVTAYHSMCVL